MNSDVKNTIREALRYKREALIELTTFDILDDADKQALVKTVDAIDAALAALTALDEQPTPLDMPDGPGWWAHDNNGRQRLAVHLRVFHVQNNMVHYQWGDDDHYKFVLTSEQFNLAWPGKWYRLTMPWEVDHE